MSILWIFGKFQFELALTLFLRFLLRAHLLDKIDEYPSSLSVGQRQRIAITHALGANRIWQFTSIQMFSETLGWASTNRDFLRTTDGGFSWQAVTPLVGKGEAFGLIEDFVDADQA